MQSSEGEKISSHLKLERESRILIVREIQSQSDKQTEALINNNEKTINMHVL